MREFGVQGSTHGVARKGVEEEEEDKRQFEQLAAGFAGQRSTQMPKD